MEDKIASLVALARRMRRMIADQRIELANSQAGNDALRQHLAVAQAEIEARQHKIDDVQSQNHLLIKKIEEARLRLQDLLGETPEHMG
ncbi:MAG: hypothetical protein KGQ58_00630 [Proteobacteria bacterium]|nr:hypothetical protein [Pseudomonadota bacterium]MDE3207592.1 hypothetical protein [Pseudomonadota bacterium]